MSLPSSARVFGARFLLALVIAALITSVTVAGALWYAQLKVDEIDTFAAEEGVEDVIDPEPDEPGQPANFLLVGSDTRAFVETDEQAEAFGSATEQGGQRSDTIMVVHVDPEAESGVVLSFPRDLWVDIPGRGAAKINAAFNDGVGKLIETIQTNFDIPIHHALQVDFSGFEGIVDAVGAVEIYFPAPTRDEKTGLRAPLPGCMALEGDQALAYVRSRDYEQWVSTDPPEGYWQKDPRADIARIARQQYFIRTLAQTAVDKSRTNPFVAKRLADESVQHLTRDEGLGFSEIQRLISTFRDVDPAVFPMETVPFTSGREGGQSVLYVDEAAAAPLFERMRTFTKPVDESESPGLAVPDLDPGSVSVRVLNGTGIAGLAADAQGALAVAGFDTPDAPGDADRSDYERTEVRYEADHLDEAYLVLLALSGDGELVEVADAGATDVEVVLGGAASVVAPPSATPSATSSDAPEPEAGPPTTVATTSSTVPLVVGPPTPGLPPLATEDGLPPVGCPDGF